jgi:hypothetical protein
MRKKIIVTILGLLCVAGFALAEENLVVPYILKAPAPITVDGILDEWGFAFPLNFNNNTVPINGRARAEGWMEEDPYDCSGTLYMMYDENYFYFAATVHDDQPGYFSDASWAADGIEFYLANWDIGDALHSADMGGMTNDAATGDYALQLGITFDVDLDSIAINCYGGYTGVLNTANTKAVYMVWDGDDGYNIEGQIYLPDVTSPTTGNTFTFTPGARIPCTWSLYDIDDSRLSADFRGLVYTPAGYAAYTGPGPGWQCADVMTTARGEAWDTNADFDFVAPYVKKVYTPVTIDGDLDEWNFCFPLDHNDNTIPSNSRARSEGWMEEDPYDCSGTLYMMYDDEYFYFAASVYDDQPGYFSDATWAADAIEYYVGNWDMGDELHPEDKGGMVDDAGSGDYALQFGITFDADLDSIIINSYGGLTGELKTDNTFAVYKIWDNYEGYNIEGKILLSDAVSPATGNELYFVPGDRLPFAWSLYDIDESRLSADFRGLVYTPAGYAAYTGPGPGWQYADVKTISSIEYIDTEVSVKDNPKVVTKYRLSQNYPNPFNPTTNIDYQLVKSEHVTIKVFNVLGEEVTTLVNGVQSAGIHRIQFDGANLNGGVYFYQLKAGDYSETRSMVLLK